MQLVKIAKTFCLLIGFTITLHASILDEIEKLSPFFFANTFDHDLYKLDTVNEYDIDEFNKLPDGEILGQILNETSSKQLDRLSQRKLKRIKLVHFKKIEDYKKELSKLNPGEIIPGLLKSGINGASAGALLRYGAEKSLKQAVMGGGGTFIASAMQVGVDICFNPTVQDELKRADILCNRLKNEIENERIKDLEMAYISKRSTLCEQQKYSIETVLLAERERQDVKKQRKLREFVNGILDLPKQALIVPSNFNVRPAKKYGDQEVADDFVDARDQFLDTLFPSLQTAHGRPINSAEAKLDSDYYPRDLREQFKNIIAKVCDYSYNSLSGVDEAVTERCIIFKGKPGTGKSKAAMLIPENCDLPYYHMQIHGELDLDKVWGNPQSFHRDGEPGAVVQAFLKKNKHGKTAKNAVIIFDDIDRADPDSVLAFLMDFTDLNKKSFTASYFGVEMDLRDVLIILTINNDWENDPRFSGLLSRSDFISFPDSPATQLKDILKTKLRDQDFQLATPYRSNPTQWDTFRTRIADFIIDQHDIDDNRQRIARAKTLLRYPQTQWAQIAIDRGW